MHAPISKNHMNFHLDTAAERDNSKSPASQNASELSHAIIFHKLTPGSKLGEDELADVYGAIRTVVRCNSLFMKSWCR